MYRCVCNSNKGKETRNLTEREREGGNMVGIGRKNERRGIM